MCRSVDGHPAHAMPPTDEECALEAMACCRARHSADKRDGLSPRPCLPNPVRRRSWGARRDLRTTGAPCSVDGDHALSRTAERAPTQRAWNASRCRLRSSTPPRRPGRRPSAQSRGVIVCVARADGRSCRALAPPRSLRLPVTSALSKNVGATPAMYGGEAFIPTQPPNAGAGRRKRDGATAPSPQPRRRAQPTTTSRAAAAVVRGSSAIIRRDRWPHVVHQSSR